MNIVVSGWPGVGETTLALLLAKTLNYKLIQGSATFRFLGEKLSFNNTGEDRVKADELLEPSWGPIFEKYNQYLVKNREKFVMETDITGFFTKDVPNHLSIFLLSEMSSRKERLERDGRMKDIEVLEDRDESLEQKYKQLFGIEFHNKDQIKNNYKLMIDNTNISITDELKMVYSKLFELKAINEDWKYNYLEQAQAEVDNYNREGKEWYLNYLKTNQLYDSAEDIIKDIKQIFPDEVSRLPKQILQIINNL